MAKPPSDAKVLEYDETRRFCRAVVIVLKAIADHTGEQAVFPLEVADDLWREGKQSFSNASRAMTMLCRDFLEMTQDYEGEALAAWDQMLTEQSSPTLSVMRARHWNLVPKMLKRGRIRNDEEYYLAKSVLDASQLAEEDRRSLAGLLGAYEFGEQRR